MQIFRLSLIATTAILGFSTSALAVDGRNAVNQCINHPKCIHSVGSSGDIIILVDEKTIYCPSATAQCEVVGRKIGKRQNADALSPDAKPLTVFPSN